MSARVPHRARTAENEQLVGDPDAPLFVAGVDPGSGEDKTLIVVYRGGQVVDVYPYEGPCEVQTSAPATIPCPPPDFEDDGVACGDGGGQ